SEAAIAVLEWSDLDSRLGLRAAGGWALSVQSDIVATCRERFARFLAPLETPGAEMPVTLAPPTLPLVLLGHTATWQASAAELELQKLLGDFAFDAGRIPGLSVLHPSCLAQVSPEPARLDPFMELNSGFPYTVEHASALAKNLVKLLY